MYGHSLQRPGAVARSDARPPGMRPVAGSILMSGNIFSWRFDHEIISTADSSKTVVSYWRKDVH